jgi:DNA invertase Pin-like site-specific DNA recombinase
VSPLEKMRTGVHLGRRRPNRKRKAQQRRNDIPAKVLSLAPRMKISQIAKILDVHRSYIHKILDNHGVKALGQRVARTVTARDIKQIVQLADAGKVATDIASATGWSSDFVYKKLRERRPNRKRTRKRTSKLRDAIKSLALHMPASEIAAKLEISRAYVYRILAEDSAPR